MAHASSADSKLAYVLAALGLWLLVRWLGSTDILSPLAQTTEALLADLRVLSPLNVLGTYYFELTGCGIDYSDTGIAANCNGTDHVSQQLRMYGISGISLLAWPAIVLWNTAVALWESSGTMGRVVYLATLPIGILGAREAVIAMSDNSHSFTGKRILEDWTLFGWALFIALIPAFAGLTALALQWLLIAIIWIFGMALAAIVWLVTIFAAPIAYLRAAMSVVKDAAELEKGHATLKGSGNSDPGAAL